MKKYLVFICHLAFLCFLSVLLSCDQSAEKTAVPKVIRKKILAKTDKTASVPKAKPGVTPKTTKPKSKPQASDRTLIAKKTDTPAVLATKPKPALKPKSDISITKPSLKPGAGLKPDTSKKEMASASPAARPKTSSATVPVYNPKGKIDPFQPLFREKTVVAGLRKKKKKRIPRTPLEKIDLSQLKLVGIILASSGNRALVEESSGKGYVISKGTFIGINSGKVVKIDKNKVIVAEEYEDVLGNVTIRNRELKIPKPPGEL